MRDLSNTIVDDHQTTIFILSDTEIGKIVRKMNSVWTNLDGEVVDVEGIFGAEPSLESEAQMLAVANTITDLFPKFYGIEEVEFRGKVEKMIVMERLYPLPIYHFDLARREEMFAILEKKVRAMHDALFLHGDMMRPLRYGSLEDVFKNFVQTETEIRLIDTGFSVHYFTNGKGTKRFARQSVQEDHEFSRFKAFYLGRE